MLASAFQTSSSLANRLLYHRHLSIRTGHGLFRHIPHNLDDSGDAARPAGLVTGSDASPVVGVEIFVEQHQVFPVGIGLEFFASPIDRPLTVVIAEKNAG